MRRSPTRMYCLAAGLVVAACGGQADDLFGPGGGASGASGSGGSPVESGGTVGNGGAPAEGGTPVSGGAGRLATGGGAGTSNPSGGASGSAAGGAGGSLAGNGGTVGNAGKGGAGGSSGSAGKGAAGGSAGTAGKGGAGGSAGTAGKGGAGGSAGTAGKGGAGGSGGTVSTGGVSGAGTGGQATCDAMRAELPKLLSAAQVCDISLDRLPCTGFVSNECGCKVPVDGPTLPAAQAYANAVAAVSKCGVICPAIACVEPVLARCQTEGTLTKGHCVVGVAP